VLIIVGAVFLLSTMRMLSFGRLLHLFANYWPVLLILWCVIKLFEHMQARREGTRSSGMGAGGVVLVVLIVFFGLIATQLQHVNWAGFRHNFNIDDNGFSNIFGDTFNFDDHLEETFPPGASLKVIDAHGAVTVRPSDDNKVAVIVRKRIAADNQADADKYNSETRPTIIMIGGLVTIDAKTDAAGDHPVESDLDISVPRKAAITISSRRGDISVSGRQGNVDISAQHSDTTVDDVSGNLKLSQERGSAKVRQVSGDVQIDGHLNDVSVSDIRGSLQLNGEFQENVKLERIAKTTTVKSSRTDLQFSRIDGELNLDPDELHADQITGPLHLTTRSKNIRLESVSGDVRVQNDNGGVEVLMHRLGNIQIDNRNGDIQLSLPEKSDFRVDARSRDGEIQSEFPGLNVNNGDHESKASGTVGNGAAHIVINNEHDNIEIRKNSPNATPAAAPTPPKPGKALPAPEKDVEPTEN